MNCDIINDIRALAAKEQIAEIGFCRIPQERLHPQVKNLPWGISLAYRLSDGVVDAITDQPTYTYFHHYRTVNAHLDRAALLISGIVEQGGFRAVPVPASQTVHDSTMRHCGLFSHKEAAVRSGLGFIGKNCLYISHEHGCRVRLVTVLTDMPLFEITPQTPVDVTEQEGCGSCELCVRACPAGALKGKQWQPGMEREELLDVQKCGDYMRGSFMHIGRGAVCGICMRVCPKGKK